jgi:hypothetical protein
MKCLQWQRHKASRRKLPASEEIDKIASVKNIFITFAKMGLWSTEFRSQTELIEEKG